MTTPNRPMKAIVYEKYGSHRELKIQEMDIPKPKAGEALVEIKGSSVNPVDWKIRRGNLRIVSGFRFPKQAGSDFSGIVRASNIAHYQHGDEVYGMINPVKGGAHAEFAIVKNHEMGRKPKNMPFHEAAALPLAGLTALQTMKYKGKIQKGHSVLINACCGGVGHFAVQYCKAQSASVTGICSTNKIDQAKKLGADKVIDYKKEDVFEIPGTYDIILDPIGNINFKRMKSKLNKNGVMIAFRPLPENILAWIYTIFTSQKLKFYLTRVNPKDLKELATLVEDQKIRPFIHEVFDLEHTSDAYQIAEEGHMAGKVAIKV